MLGRSQQQIAGDQVNRILDKKKKWMYRNAHPLFLFYLSILQDLLDIEDLAEARHVEHILDQWLEVADNQLATLLSNHLVQAQEYTQTGAADIIHFLAIHDYHIAQFTSKEVMLSSISFRFSEFIG